MLLILTAALLPLGLIALFASVQSAHTKRLQRNADAVVLANAEARQIDVLLLRGANVLRGELSADQMTRVDCARQLQRDAAGFSIPIRLALVGLDGVVRCATPGFAPDAIRHGGGRPLELTLTDTPPALRFTIGAGAAGYGVGELPLALLQQVMPRNDQQGIVVTRGLSHLRLTTAAPAAALQQHLTIAAPIAGGQAHLRLTVVASPISAVEVLLVLLPILMWTAAAAIGWVVVDHLLVRPLKQLQQAVSDYGAGGDGFDLPNINTPSHEIRALGDAFAATTAELSRRGAELEQGLNHQVRLTREVHHRVKNNLQVVASLINLHSRGTQGEVAAAYASIQRRVDALAVVHRNHFAELEENRGVALRSILAELTANLRATAPPAASHLAITLDMIPAFITQDVAVPVAFLVTEVVELVMICDPTGRVTIALSPGETPDRAILGIIAPGLAADECRAVPNREQFERILLGLSRQLRTQIAYDAALGAYRIAIAVIPQIAEA